MAGMPDLRLAPDRFLSLEADRAKAVAVLDKARGRGYGAALEAYWSLTPELEPSLARGHLHRQLCEREAGAGLWQEVEQRCGAPSGPVLDVGCGLGGFVAAAAKNGRTSVGLDAAFRWTLIARLLLEEAAVDAVVLCANAEYPPFRAKTFELAVANDLIEHVTDPPTAVAGAARAASTLYLASTHRFSLAPEPHVRLFGVGWLPRRMQSGYVKMRRGHAYDRVRPVTAAELTERVEAAGLTPGEVFAAPVFAGHLGFRARTALRALERVPRFAPRIGVLGR
ncbi:MAG: class I SAM-dependent methyltransferase [Bryobacterales bacterium]|nr:class I SAM-dependent methyltransferase [Bryobacterales bacterium]